MIQLSKPATDLIKTRRSWRSYHEGQITDAQREHVQTFISGLDRAPFGSHVRLILADAPSHESRKVKGTYGVISGASSFLVGILRESTRCFIDYGYLFEAAVLEITSLGLGSCWMGGTFSRTIFSDLAELMPGEIIPTVSPVGNIAQKRTFTDAMFVFAAGSRARKDWPSLFFQESFGTPLNQAAASAFSLPLEMVRLAPSSSNRQPWRIVMDTQGFHFYLTRTFGYGALFKDVDLQAIDMGIAMLHFEQTAHELGLNGSWNVLTPGISLLPARTEYVVSWIP